MTTRRINASSNIDFTGSNYKIAKWTPAITRRDSSPLSLPFADVVETVEVEVTGSTATDAYDKAADMAAMLDEVTDFRNGDASAVTFDYEPPGAANGVQQALITRYLGINYPTANDIESGANQGVIAPVTIQFERRGLWLEDAEDTSTQTSANTPDTVHTTSFSASHDTRCPVDITIDSSEFDGALERNSQRLNSRSWDGYIFATNDSDNIKVFTAGGSVTAPLGTDWGTASEWSEVSGSSLYSSDSDVLQYSGTAEATRGRIVLNSSGFSALPTRFAVFVTARRVSGATLLLKAQAYDAVSDAPDANSQSTDYIAINSDTPFVYRVGEISMPEGATYLALTGKSSGGTVTAQIDQIIVMKLTDQSYALRMHPLSVEESTDTFDIRLEQQALTSLTPRLVANNGTYNTYLPYDGTPHIYLSGQSVSVVFCIADGTHWMPVFDGVTPSKIQIQVTASRRLARVIAT